MKKYIAVTVAVLLLNLFGASAAAVPNSASAEEQVSSGITVYETEASQGAVSGLFMMMDYYMPGIERALLLDPKTCWNLRTTGGNYDLPLERLNMEFYKDSVTGASHLIYPDGQMGGIARMIGYSGGLGVTSLALGDLNGDGSHELYFTFSWTPDGYCAQAGWFDPGTAEIHYFGDYALPDAELVFAEEDGALVLRKAAVSNCEDKVHYDLTEEETVGRITCTDGLIAVEALSDALVHCEEPLVPTEQPLPEWVPGSLTEAEAFRKETPEPVIRNGIICCVMNLGAESSYDSGTIYAYASEKSDIQVPLSYRIFPDESLFCGTDYVACYEMPPCSYLEICEEDHLKKPHWRYYADENGEIRQIGMGDINAGSETNAADSEILQSWLLGDAEAAGCWQTADLLDDRNINAADLTLMQREILAQNAEPAGPVF